MSQTERRKPSSDLIMGLIGGMLILSMVSYVVVYPILPCDLRILGDLWLDSCDTVIPPKVSCEVLIKRALTVSDIGCEDIGSNEICYGHDDIDATVLPAYEGQFDNPGDVIPIEGVQRFYTSPLDEEKGVWGIAWLKVRANMTGAVPGQNVTIVVFGDTDVENSSGDTKALYFTSGITGTTCNQVPVDSILITADGIEIIFQANGVDILLPPSPPPPPPPPPPYTPDPRILECLLYGVGCPATPTPSPTPHGCSGSFIIISAGGSGGQFIITNNSSSNIVINQITLNWPVGDNGEWRRIYLDGKKIKEHHYKTSPETLTLTGDILRRTIEMGNSETLQFTFDNDPPASTGYSVTITFDIGCSWSGSQ